MQRKKQFEVIDTHNNQNKPIAQPPLINPVSDLWEIELFYGRHSSFSELTYAVELKTKLVGGASRCYLVIELKDRFEEILYDLNVFGVMERNSFLRTIDYIIQLKIRGIYREVPDLLQVINGQADSTEGRELYEQVMDSILNDIESYPTVSSNMYEPKTGLGVILDTDQYRQKYGSLLVGVSSEALQRCLASM